MMKYDPEAVSEVEQTARYLCREDGIDPDQINWMGDLEVINGTISWPAWREYEDEARSVLSVNRDNKE